MRCTSTYMVIWGDTIRIVTDNDDDDLLGIGGD